MVAKLESLSGALAAFSILPALAQEARAATADELVAGWHRRSLTSGGLEHWFRIFVRERGMAGRPVVLLLHGGGQSMDKVVSDKSGSGRYGLSSHPPHRS